MFSFGFGGPGGHPFEGMHGHGHGHEEPKEVDTTGLYETLGVEKSATPSQIKKAFRKAAMKHHPDKGGDEHKFKEIQKAYEILSDPEKRSIYDEHGEEGVERGGGRGGGMDIFDLFTGGGGRGRSGPAKGEDVVFPLKVSLEDLFNGATKRLRLTRNVLCGSCNATGSKSGKSTKCQYCEGRGVRVQIRQLAPGMIQQMRGTCDRCRGTGKAVDPSDICGSCKGNRVKKEKKTLEVHVDKGMKQGQRIPFLGEADQAPGMESGDVVVVLQQKEHPVFTRDGPHLAMSRRLTLVEALTGFHFTVKHLDGRDLVIRSKPGQIIKPNSILCAKDEGMPTYRQPFVRGSLLVKFEVVFPESLDASTASVLKKALPAPDIMDDIPEGDHDEAVLDEFDVEAERRRRESERRGQREAYDEDDEEHVHGPWCRSM